MPETMQVRALTWTLAVDVTGQCPPTSVARDPSMEEGAIRARATRPAVTVGHQERLTLGASLLVARAPARPVLLLAAGPPAPQVPLGRGPLRVVSPVAPRVQVG